MNNYNNFNLIQNLDNDQSLWVDTGLKYEDEIDILSNETNANPQNFMTNTSNNQLDNSLPNLTNLDNINTLAYDTGLNSYNYDYQTGYNSSSNSSTLPMNNDFSTFNNQQNLVSSANDSRIPSFCETFNQSLDKNQNQNLIYYSNDNHQNHQTNHLNNFHLNHQSNVNLNNNHQNYHLNNHHSTVINNSFSNSLSSASSCSSTNLSMNHSLNNCLNPPTIDQSNNHPINNQFTFQNNFNRSIANQQLSSCQFANTPIQQPTNFCYKENIDMHNALDAKQLDQKEKKRELNNDRERNRVRKMNLGFDVLGKTCGNLLNDNSKMTKLGILENSYKLITHLENKVQCKMMEKERANGFN